MELCALLAGWPVELISTRAQGRNLRVTRDQSCGSPLLACDAAGFVVHHTARSRWCHGCLRYASREESALDRRCLACFVPHYCSETCAMQDKERHAFECNVFVHMNRSALKNEVMSLVIYLCHILSKLSVQRHVEGAPPVSLEHILAMQMDSSTTTGSKRHQKHKIAAVAFVKQHMHIGYDSSTLLRVLSSLPLNEFGLWGDHTFNGCCGSILFPAAALINHSCVPNCVLHMEYGIMKVYALTDLPAGTVLYQSYLDLRLPTDERKQLIRQSWQFTCRCVRCEDETSVAVREFAAMLCVCGGVLLPGTSQSDECVCNKYNKLISSC